MEIEIETVIEEEMDIKERTLFIIDGRIRGVQAHIDRMNEVLEQCYDTGGHLLYVVDEEKAAAEIKRLKSARRRVVKDLDPLPKYDWKQSA